MSAIPHTARGLAYKVQFYEEHTMSWRDVQKRYAFKSQAIVAAFALLNKNEVRVRLMELNLDTGKREPVAI